MKEYLYKHFRINDGTFTDMLSDFNGMAGQAVAIGPSGKTLELHLQSGIRVFIRPENLTEI